MRAIQGAVVLLTVLAGCSSMGDRLPWHRAPAAAPVPVRELRVEAPADAQMPIVLQFLERNVLVVDLSEVASQGSIRLHPGPTGRWPARLALRFQPGRFERVEVQGAERVIYPVTADGSGRATVDVPPAVHGPGVDALTVRWGPR